MRVLFTSLRNTGHFQPLVPFIQACLRHGYEVGVAAPEDIAEQVKASGARFFPVGHPGDEGLGPIWARMRGASHEDSLRIVVQEIFAGACAQSALPELIEAMAAFRPQIVIREGQEYGGVIAAEKAAVPHARVAISLSESELFPLSNPVLEGYRRDHGIAADPLGLGLQKEPVLTRFPPSFDLLHTDDAPVYRFSARAPEGALRLSARAPKALPDWWPGNSDPFVYLTLGTVTGNNPSLRGAYRVALEAVGGLPIRVLLTTGAELLPDALGSLPANVHVERFVPQDDILAHARVVLCHGGSGTVLGALAAGVPLVVMPLFADQPQNAERVVHTGAGLAVANPGSLEREQSVATLRAALSRVLEESQFRANALRVRDELAELPEIDQAAEVIAQLAQLTDSNNR